MLEPKAKKEVQVKKDDEKVVAVTITTSNMEEVGLSAGMRKQQPIKLPLAYDSSYVMLLTKLDDKLFEDKVLIFEYVFGNAKIWMTGNILNQSLYNKCIRWLMIKRYMLGSNSYVIGDQYVISCVNVYLFRLTL